jgi:hypothetical protein
VNGDLFSQQMISADEKKGILACVFYEGVGHEWIAKDLLFTAHKEGIVRVRDSVLSILISRFGVDTYAREPNQTSHRGN